MKRTDDQSRVRPLPPSRYAPPARRLLRIFDTNSCKICHRPHRRAREPARGTQARTSRTLPACSIMRGRLSSRRLKLECLFRLAMLECLTI
jgi:hypothetical protein